MRTLIYRRQLLFLSSLFLALSASPLSAHASPLPDIEIKELSALGVELAGNQSRLNLTPVSPSGAKKYKYKIVAGAAGSQCKNKSGYPDAYRPISKKITDSIAKLKDGSIRICIFAEPKGKDSAPYKKAKAFQYVKDTSAPGKFSISPVELAGQTATIKWNAPSDSTKVHFEAVFSTAADCRAVTNSAMTSALTASARLSVGNYYACVTAIDMAGNRTSAINNGVSFSIAELTANVPAADTATPTPTSTPTPMKVQPISVEVLPSQTAADEIQSPGSELFFVEARAGDRVYEGPTAELLMGPYLNTAAVTEQFVFPNGQNNNFILSFDPATSTVTFTLRQITMTYPSVGQSDQILIRLASVDGTTATIDQLIFSNASGGGALTPSAATASGAGAVAILNLYGVDLSTGFVLSGRINLSWIEQGGLPTDLGSTLGVQIRVGKRPPFRPPPRPPF